MIARCSLRAYYLTKLKEWYRNFYSSDHCDVSQDDSSTSIRADVQQLAVVVRDSGLFRDIPPKHRPPSQFSIFPATAAMSTARFEGNARNQILEFAAFGYGTEITGWQPVVRTDALGLPPINIGRGDVVLGVYLLKSNADIDDTERATEGEGDSNVTEPDIDGNALDQNVTKRSSKRKEKQKRRVQLVQPESVPLQTVHPLRPPSPILDVNVNSQGGIDVQIVPLSQTLHAGTYPTDLACVTNIQGEVQIIVGLGDEASWVYSCSSDGPTWKQNKGATGILDCVSMCAKITSLLATKIRVFRLQVVPLVPLTLRELLERSSVEPSHINSASTIVLCTYHPGTPVMRAKIAVHETAIIEKEQLDEPSIFGSLHEFENHEVLMHMKERTSRSGNKEIDTVHIETVTKSHSSEVPGLLSDSDISKRLNNTPQLFSANVYKSYIKRQNALRAKLIYAQDICAGKEKPRMKAVTEQGSSGTTPESKNRSQLATKLEHLKSVRDCVRALEDSDRALKSQKRAITSLLNERDNQNKALLQVQDHLFQVHWHAARKEANWDISVAQGGKIEQNELSNRIQALDNKLTGFKRDRDDMETAKTQIALHMAALVAKNTVGVQTDQTICQRGDIYQPSERPDSNIGVNVNKQLKRIKLSDKNLGKDNQQTNQPTPPLGADPQSRRPPSTSQLQKSKATKNEVTRLNFFFIHTSSYSFFFCSYIVVRVCVCGYICVAVANYQC